MAELISRKVCSMIQLLVAALTLGLTIWTGSESAALLGEGSAFTTDVVTLGALIVGLPVGWNTVRAALFAANMRRGGRGVIGLLRVRLLRPTVTVRSLRRELDSLLPGASRRGPPNGYAAVAA